MPATFTVQGDLKEKIESLLSAMEDLEPLLSLIGEEIVAYANERFDTGTSPFGDTWAPLAESTQRINPRRTSGLALLDSGRLRNSLTFRVDGASVSVGTNVIYGAKNQFGDPNNILFGKAIVAPIPARPFLPIDGSGVASLPEDLQSRLDTLVRDYLVNASAG